MCPNNILSFGYDRICFLSSTCIALPRFLGIDIKTHPFGCLRGSAVCCFLSGNVTEFIVLLSESWGTYIFKCHKYINTFFILWEIYKLYTFVKMHDYVWWECKYGTYFIFFPPSSPHFLLKNRQKTSLPPPPKASKISSNVTSQAKTEVFKRFKKPEG